MRDRAPIPARQFFPGILIFSSITTPKIETERLSLEPVTVAHAQELVDLFADPSLHTYISFEPPTLEQQLARCVRWEVGQSPDGSERWLNWVARDNVSGRVVGHFQAGVKLDGSTSVAYVVAKASQGRGFAFEAMTAVFAVLKDNFNATEVKAWTDTRNTASHRLAAKLGMSIVETIQDADHFKGSTSHEYVFALKFC